MTFVGKILVIAIMAFALLFLGISTVVFTTSKNWRDATKAEQKKSDELKKKLQDALAVSDSAKKSVEDAKSLFAAETKALTNRLSEADAEHQRDLQQIQAARGQLVTAQQTAESTLQEADAKGQQTALLRTQLSTVEKQANEFKLRQAELNDRIRELERTMDTATKNNSDLRERVAKFSTLLRQSGLSDDISQIKGLESPPPVAGEVTRIDPTNRRVELTIGSDDGLVVGHELYIYRINPRPEYIGKVVIVTVEPDRAVAKVIGNTYQGKKIKEGDIVSSTIKPQF
jgi:multidrug efflux pump subunit AcrA (membrane-fusion protein)